ncbi:MAG: cell division protein FtsA [Oscillospiraceae bacterium]|nr:cell division protein FtsA [Oscillospiraceae bacterium]
MAIGDIIVGIDIGTSKVSTVVGEVNNFNQVEIIGTAEAKCFGMKKSQIIDEDEIVGAITKTTAEIQTNLSMTINSAYVTIPGKYVKIVQNSIVKEAKDKYAGISSKDVGAAMLQIKDIEIPEDKVLIDIVASEFSLDNGRVIEDPVGSLSNTFTVKGQVVLADKEYVKKTANIFKKAGLEIDGIVPNVLAERALILDSNELNDNVMILDVGAGNTDIGVFNSGSFIFADTIPIGGDTVTTDIAYVFNITEEEADRLKKQYGLALRSFIDNDTDIMLNTYKGEERTKTIKSSELIEVIEARVEEIFSIVNKTVTSEGIKSDINNVILTGQGITNLNKSDVAGKIALNIPVKISTGRGISVVRPSDRSSYALVKYIAARPFVKSVSSSIDIQSEGNVLGTIAARVKDFFYS